jgi:hypothetical protein
MKKNAKSQPVPVVAPSQSQRPAGIGTSAPPAKSLGLDVPLFFQQRADEVIE